ncbi:flagellar basal body rod protein FlgB [Cohnella caldifontis]|uniref:flagellar basal body rod protein FlgB n=1 Tax=Cohnella caldifontis TaxID=3027471 RepID=UPI0023EAEAD2|nr:flagellar basal body rod protein FlgB [Cohnella sp. YIM B05605]
MDLLNGVSFQRLEGAIRAASMRQQVLANNVANVDTPYYKRSDVNFESLLAQSMGEGEGRKMAIRATDPRHFGSGVAGQVPEAAVVTEDSSVMNNNRNNVDIDREMSLVAENQLRYNLYIQQANHEVKMMRLGIEGR